MMTSWLSYRIVVSVVYNRNVIELIKEIPVSLVVIPHLGSATIKTRDDMAILAVQNILNGLEGKPLVRAAY